MKIIPINSELKIPEDTITRAFGGQVRTVATQIANRATSVFFVVYGKVYRFSCVYKHVGLPGTWQYVSCESLGSGRKVKQDDAAALIAQHLFDGAWRSAPLSEEVR